MNCVEQLLQLIVGDPRAPQFAAQRPGMPRDDVPRSPVLPGKLPRSAVSCATIPIRDVSTHVSGNVNQIRSRSSARVISIGGLKVSSLLSLNWPSKSVAHCVKIYSDPAITDTMLTGTDTLTVPVNKP